MSILEKLSPDETLKLPSLPAVGLKIIESLKDENFSIEELSGIISSDPALAAKTIGVANSALYGLPSPVDTIERAVSIMGGEALKNIALSFVIVSGLSKYKVDGFKHEYFWKRSVTAAVAADLLSKQLKIKPNTLFITALLMDIGILGMYMLWPGEYAQIMKEDEFSELSLSEIEQNGLGFSHQAVGKEMLDKWGIPDTIYGPIGLHHGGGPVPAKYAEQVDILNVADAASSIYHGTGSVDRHKYLREILTGKFGYSDVQVTAFLDDVALKAVEILSGFKIDSGDMLTYTEILQQANEELSKLNMGYEYLVIELKESKARAEGLAAQLREANSKLKGLAFQDSLTGLCNHRFFHEMMDKEIHRVERNSQFFSLIVFDIDDFKAVNDVHGHTYGDEVLKSVCAKVLESVRKYDVAARLGGDEFSILLPDADTREAVMLAERLRRSIEALTLKSKDSRDINFTISLGVGTYSPEKGKLGKDDIIDKIDRALYRSKEVGKNRVSTVSLS